MNTFTEEETDKKLLNLARRGRYKTGLRLIDKYFKKHKTTDGMYLRKAFFLYHHAATLMYGNKNIPGKNFFIQEGFESAIAICKLIIKKHRDTDNIHLNARIYLAQIYAMLGVARKAKHLQDKLSSVIHRLSRLSELPMYS